MIEKIDIKNLGCFSGFSWNAAVRDHGNNINKFKRLNIIYGRNYSGKTTLSRIVRSLETGVIPPRYDAPSFTVDLSNGTINQKQIPAQGVSIRVYNKDFVDEHLSFLRDNEGNISPFAVLGSENKEIEAQIKKLQVELGGIEEQTGLRYSYQEKNKEFNQKKRLAKEARDEIDKKIFDKANKSPTGIKHNQIYRDVNYDARKIRADITAVRDGAIIPLEENERSAKVILLGETTLPDVNKHVPFNLALASLSKLTLELSTKRIKPSSPIQELLNDNLLQSWVKLGIQYHKESRSTCAFCGNLLPEDIWKKLGDHFNQESQDLERDVISALAKISNERSNLKNVPTIDRKGFYSINQPKFDACKSELDQEIVVYEATLSALEGELNARRSDIFTERAPITVPDNTDELLQKIAAVNRIIDENNKTTISLDGNQKAARKDLRLSEVAQFIIDIDLVAEDKKIEALEEQSNNAKRELDCIEAEGKKLTERIKELEKQIRDEKRGAEKVNQYLGHFLSHGGLRLSAAEDATTSTYRFQIMRDDQVAYNLSEGECSLVAFCYFIAKLEDIETSGRKPIIYIDDPISSLDSNHIFFIYSLIENYLAKPIGDAHGEVVVDADKKRTYRYEQMFISTHNLEFLKYLKRLSKPKNEQENFIIAKKPSGSVIGLMPTYLRNYVTELNYLFGEIYCCSSQDNESTQYHSFYNFGNNLRKFLEAFLFFKYPSSVSGDYDKRIAMFFADGTNSEALVQRLTNEFSHLGEFIDRGAQPIDCAEIAVVAKFVLKKIRDNDKQQFDHLLLSIEKLDPFTVQ